MVGDRGQLVGIVSRSDVLSVYNRPDEEIRLGKILENVILNGIFADPDRFTVTVSSGIVTLEGHPETTARGREIVAEAWHVEGVVSVRDRLRKLGRKVNPHAPRIPVPEHGPGRLAELALIAVVAISGDRRLARRRLPSRPGATDPRPGSGLGLPRRRPWPPHPSQRP